MVLVNWEWMGDGGEWMPYEHVDNLLIETAFQDGTTPFKTTKLSFNAEYNSLYVFDFKKKTQTNTESGRVRKLRRIETGDDDGEDAGFASVVKALSMKLSESAPAATPSPPLPAAAAVPSPTPTTTPSPKVGAKKEKESAVSDDEDAPKAKKAKGDDGAPVPSPPTSKPDAGSPKTDVKTAASSAAATSVVPLVPDAVVAAQTALGAQSRRHQPYDLGPVAGDPHGKRCFDKMLSRESQLCGEWAVFYHSYSYAALLYEVQAAVAAVLFRFKSEYGSLPRLLKAPFRDLPDAEALLALFPSMKSRDHDPRFRAVAISGTSSLLAGDSEAPPKHCFLHGYSCTDLCFLGVLEGLLVSCGVPSADKSTLAKKIVTLSSEHGLDVSQFKGKGCKSGRAGHMLQIFVKRSLVDRYVYGALPFGVKDPKRPHLSKYLEGAGPIQGQVRVVMNPSVFMRGSAVRMYVYSADPSYHSNRGKFQLALAGLLEPIIGTPAVRTKAAEGIYDGTLPLWFSADDYEKQQGEKAKAATSPTATVAGAPLVTVPVVSPGP